ncbi:MULTISPECIES: AAA family ATPase [Campylobacter]|uniref:Bacteriocin n=1 Tax=Campylobacter taeniopygiae TaxID=2510188 RepID=A0ABY2TK99_9BACT|nr:MULTISPECIES: AAA family ATPase [Campylobacter]EAI5420473.1 bacteriocin [Campylobacter coli]EAK0103512.1 bacteriocin [Campylobacter coli]EAK2110028.1 bacteriocin [Campylobacter jejuni]EAL7061389.1 bacteriocin [Campylobacter jejuni]EDC2883076.1 AAA family ATPase [Campylobacter coli]
MQELSQELECFLKQSGMKPSALARAIGASASLISQIKSASYKGDVALWAKKIRDFIALYQDKNEVEIEKETIFKSRDFSMASFVMSEAVNEKEIALIFGEAGTGKTTIIKEFIKNKPQSILIEATCHTSVGVMLDELLLALKIEANNNNASKLKAIARFLKANEKILIVDEAEYLPLKALEDLRRIADFARVPLILVGTEILYKNLMGKNKELKQLYSRICGKWMMKGLSKEESDEFFGKSYFKFTNGNFRSSAKLLKKALRLAELEECEINDDLILSASEMVIL